MKTSKSKALGKKKDGWKTSMKNSEGKTVKLPKGVYHVGTWGVGGNKK